MEGGWLRTRASQEARAKGGWVGAVAGCCVGQPDWARVRCCVL